MPDSFVFRLVPRDQRVSIDTLQRTIGLVAGVVRGVDQAVSRNWRRRRVWFVEQIHSSNPTIQVVPGEFATFLDTSAFADTAQVLVQGLGALAEGELDSPPAYFSEDEMNKLWRLGSVFRSGLTRIDSWAQPTADRVSEPTSSRVARFSSSSTERVERILGSGYTEYGSIEGQLGVLRARHGISITVWDSLHAKATRCSLDREFLERAKMLLEKRVRVSGLVRYYNDGRPAHVTEVSDVADLSPILSRPRATFGSIPDLTGGQDTVEYLDRLRERPDG